jgi:glutamyl-tRNA synthetase
MSVRTRFAPSPTGTLHIGGVRTALFNYLFARHHGGIFALRIEDTDRERSTPESIVAILDGMRWLGLEWDEGPVYQSERGDRYTAQMRRLEASGHAYRCVCTPDELEARRQAALGAGARVGYDRTCRDRRDLPADRPAVLRFKAPLDGSIHVDDLVKGPVIFQVAELDDFVIARSDGTPVYNFCVVVDDVDMAITHVIRGDDHLTNTPRQILLYEALGAPLPRFAHLPMILGADKTRLSKRHGATSVTSYRDLGHLPDAVVNYLARLGWSHGDQEIFTRAELVTLFGLEQVGRSAAVFDPEKLEWVNAQWLKATPPATLADALPPLLEARGLPVPDDRAWLARVVATLQERSRTLAELAEGARFYLREEVDLDPKAAAKHLDDAVRPALVELADRLAALPAWTAGTIEAAFHAVVEGHQLKLGKLAQPVRVAVTGGTVSPGIFEVLDVLGRERSLARLAAAVAHIDTARAPAST